MTDQLVIKGSSDTNSLIVLRSFPQGYPGLLWKLSWVSSSPADALALGVVNVPEIIQRSGLPNLQHAQQIFTDGNQSDQYYNYTLKILWHQSYLCACGLANYSGCWYADAQQSSCIPKPFCGCRACHVVWLKTSLDPVCSNQTGI